MAVVVAATEVEVVEDTVVDTEEVADTVEGDEEEEAVTAVEGDTEEEAVEAVSEAEGDTEEVVVVVVAVAVTVEEGDVFRSFVTCFSTKS